jgi:hypothetical protein
MSACFGDKGKRPCVAAAIVSQLIRFMPKLRMRRSIARMELVTALDSWQL